MRAAIKRIFSTSRPGGLSRRALFTLAILSLLASGVTVAALAPAGTKRLATTGAGTGEDSPVAARVNGEPITVEELQRMLEAPANLDRLNNELGVENQSGDELERLALGKLIKRRLALQEARRRNITVSEDDVDKALVAARNEFEDLKSFGVWMKERGLNDGSLFDTIRRDIMSNRLTVELVRDVLPTEEEVKQYFETHKDELGKVEEVRLRIIAVRSMEEAEQIMAALREGGNFSRLARTRSVGARARQGGDTGWVNTGDLPPPIRDIVAALRPGQAASPFRKSEKELLIIGLAGRRSNERTLEGAKDEIVRRLLPEKQKEAVRAWLAEQEKKSEIVVLLQPGSLEDRQKTKERGK